MLEIKQLTKCIGDRVILDQLNFSIPVDHSVAIVGESGSGKSTLARIIMALEQPTTGQVLYDGIPAPMRKTSQFKHWYKKIQFIFQNTAASLDPRMTIAQIIEEPLYHFTEHSRRQRRELVMEYVSKVGFPLQLLNELPGRLSGGQYQRACIAKALIVRPKLLVCDEIVSNLDMIHQYQIVELLQTLKVEHKLSLLFITHDMSLVPQLCDQVAVMKDGRISLQY